MVMKISEAVTIANAPARFETDVVCDAIDRLATSGLNARTGKVFYSRLAQVESCLQELRERGYNVQSPL